MSTFFCGMGHYDHRDDESWAGFDDADCPDVNDSAEYANLCVCMRCGVCVCVRVLQCMRVRVRVLSALCVCVCVCACACVCARV